MTNINWKVRLKNKTFVLSLVTASFLVVQTVLVPFGYQWDFGVLNDQIGSIINAIFALLTILGIVTDPTTSGVVDSTNALGYEEPKANTKQEAKSEEK